jgi:hypothetical protein
MAQKYVRVGRADRPCFASDAAQGGGAAAVVLQTTLHEARQVIMDISIANNVVPAGSPTRRSSELSSGVASRRLLASRSTLRWASAVCSTRQLLTIVGYKRE